MLRNLINHILNFEYNLVQDPWGFDTWLTLVYLIVESEYILFLVACDKWSEAMLEMTGEWDGDWGFEAKQVVVAYDKFDGGIIVE